MDNNIFLSTLSYTMVYCKRILNNSIYGYVNGNVFICLYIQDKKRAINTTKTKKFLSTREFGKN